MQYIDLSPIIALYSTVLYCIVLYCCVHCTNLHCSIIFSTVLILILLHFIVPEVYMSVEQCPGSTVANLLSTLDSGIVAPNSIKSALEKKN